MKSVCKIFAIILSFSLLCGCGAEKKVNKAEKAPEIYKTSFAFGDIYTTVGITYNNVTVFTANLYDNGAKTAYEALFTADFTPVNAPKTEKENPVRLCFENSGIAGPQKSTAEFLVFTDNTVKFTEDGKELYFSAKDGVCDGIKAVYDTVSSEIAKYCIKENGEYTLISTSGKTVKIAPKTDSVKLTLYKPGVLKIEDGTETYYFDCEKGVLSGTVSGVSDYSFGHIASVENREIKLVSSFDSRLSYTINTFEKALSDDPNSLFFVKFADDSTLTVAYSTADGVYSQNVDLSSYYKDYEEKVAAANAVAAKKPKETVLPKNYTYDPPTAATVNGIPPFTAEMDARLMQYTNVRAGYGWKNAENRQDYYSAFNAYSTGDRSKNRVYLTFDEGYEYNENTNRLLDILAAKNVKAVFFVTMDFARKRPDLISRMINEGHVVGNHSTTHPSFVNITTRQGYDEIKNLHDYIAANFGYTMKLFRFPEGVASDRALALVKEMGYCTVFWNCAYADWDTSKQPSYDQARTVVANNTKNGTIYLFHAVSDTSVDMMGEIIDTVRGRGYEFALFGE